MDVADVNARPDHDRDRGCCIIMAGGRGTRFWPLSRSARPKQLLPLGDGQSLLRETWERVEPLVGADRILVVTNREQAAGVAAVLPELPADRIIAEPVGRNTAACSALGVALAERVAGPGPVALLPADHAIPDVDAFRARLAEAFALSDTSDGAVTFGIRPTRPATGYGYLETGEPVGSALRGLTFREKPDLETARSYVESGRHFWNSGIFVWNSAVFSREVERCLPDLAAALAPAVAAWGTDGFDAALADAYADCPSVSVDVGVMERQDGYLVLEAGFRWSDLGSWDAWGELAPELDGGNRGRGRVLSVGSAGNVVYGGERLVTLLGVDDLVVVDTPDALLVARKEDAERLRDVIDRIEDEGPQELL